ncbi:MAG TPA: hypothetical protein VHP81_13250, partial [Lachnospiraceae bacterium]|nr:hypothetical protein [Lachnospiraceae bacterium]
IHDLPLSSKAIVDSIMNLLEGCGFLGKEEASRKAKEQTRRKLDTLNRRKERLLELYVMEEVALEEYRKLDRKLCKEIDELEKKLEGKEERITNRLEKNCLEKADIFEKKNSLKKAVILEKESYREKTGNLEKENNLEKADILEKENNQEKTNVLQDTSIFQQNGNLLLSNSLIKNSIMKDITIDEELDREARDNRDIAINKDQIIRDYLNSIITGELWDDHFYKRILDRVVIYTDSISVSLSYIAGEWRYYMSSL